MITTEGLKNTTSIFLACMIEYQFDIDEAESITGIEDWTRSVYANPVWLSDHDEYLGR